MSKRLISIILILSLALSNVVVTYGATTSAKVTAVSGTVKVKRSGSTKEFDAFVNMSVGVGDKVTTGADGSVSIVVDDVNVIKANKSTSFTFKNLSKVGKEPSSAYTIHYGSVNNTVNKKGFAKDSYKVNTSNTVMGVRGTVFEVAKKISETGDQDISLVTIDGVVAVSNMTVSDDGTSSLNEVGSVSANQQIVFSNNDSKSGEVVVLDINKLGADSLRWLLDNKQFLNPEQVNNVGMALEKEEKFEKEKQDKINEFKQDNQNDSSKNVMMPPNENNKPPQLEDDDFEDNNDEDGETDGNGGTDGNGEQVHPVSPLLPAVRPVYPVSPLLPVEKPVYPVSPLLPAEKPVYPVSPIIPATRIDYEVNNVEDFVKLNKMLVTSGSALYGTISFTNDINMSTVTDWQPANINNFTINGNMRTISNLKITKTDADSNIGLFGTMSDSTINSLNLDTIITDSPNATYAGALAGRIGQGSEINDVIVSNSTITGNYAGGIAGLSKSNINSPIVLASTIQGVTIGGVTGAIIDATIYYMEVGGVTIQATYDEGIRAVGGVAGYANNAEIKDHGVFDTNFINSIIATYGPAGGIVGKASNTTIKNVRVITKGNISSSSVVGGIIGIADNCSVQKADIQANSLVAFRNSGGVIGIANGTNDIDNIYLNMGTVASIAEGANRIVSQNNGVLNIKHTISIIEGYYGFNLGSGSGTINASDSYYLVGDSTSDTNGAKTEEELKNSGLYTGWDTEIWNIVDGTVPTLK